MRRPAWCRSACGCRVTSGALAQDHGRSSRYRTTGVVSHLTEVHDPGAMGLAGMRERAMMLGGEVRIEGVPDVGTTVTVHIPMESEHD